MRGLIIIIFTIYSISFFSQLKKNDFTYPNDSVRIDTLHLFLSQSSLSPRIIKRELFGCNCSYNFSPDTNNKTDQVILGNTKNNKVYYIFIYNKQSKLIAETHRAYGNEILGKSKFYKKGKLRRTENYEQYLYTDTITNKKFYRSDGYEKSGLWKYYRKNGLLKKTINYDIYKYSNNKLTFLEITSYYNKKGELIKEETIELDTITGS